MAATATHTPWLPVAQRVVERHQYEEIDDQILDAVTAGLLVQIHGKLNDENATKFEKMPIEKAVTIAWRLVK